jgi:hypothetical protein
MMTKAETCKVKILLSPTQSVTLGGLVLLIYILMLVTVQYVFYKGILKNHGNSKAKYSDGAHYFSTKFGRLVCDKNNSGFGITTS